MSIEPSHGVPLSFDAEGFGRIVADAIVKSSLGKHIETAVVEAVGSLTRGSFYGESVIKKAIEQHVREIVHDELRTRYSEKIRDAVRAAFTDELVDKVIANAVERIQG